LRHQFQMNHLFRTSSVLSFALVLSACGVLNPDQRMVVENSSTLTSVGSGTRTPFQPEGFVPPPAATKILIPAAQIPTSAPLDIWISPTVPDLLRQLVFGFGLTPSSDSASATVRLDASTSSDSRSAVWIYALVAPFPTVTDDVSIADIQAAWSGAEIGPFAGRPLWMDETTLAAFTAVWGVPHAGSFRLAPSAQLLDSLWADRPAWAIVPFELLEPRWKVLTVDGQSPVHNDFNPSTYPLKINFNLSTSEYTLIPTNRDPARLTVLAMTGTTALVRATADRMERNGILYPGEVVRTALRAADITHISNEISFTADCPPPDQWTDSLQFCSDPRYIALLEDVGTDVVDLTGNHLLDYGPQPLLTTIDMYDQRGWRHFGGGRDLQDALQPALIEDHGNKFAFIGCNYVGPSWDWATNSTPGSTPCDLNQLSIDIGNLRSEGYLPIMTFQYSEYYQPEPSENEQRDFLKMASAGAVIVSGSQSHVPAAMGFSSGSFIHYGLGNLFFDQMSHIMPDGSLNYDTRNVFIDRHIFYNGRYISTELLSYKNEDYSRPRLMTPAERQEFLQQIFSAAGW
jgi:hypothetical protein